MTRRPVQPQRASAAVALPAVGTAPSHLGRCAAPGSAATTGALQRTTVVCPPGQPAVPAAARALCGRPPPLA